MLTVMGILDQIQPAAAKPRPTQLSVEGSDLALQWDDGSSHRLPLVLLRSRCPCAGCVDEWTGRRLLNVTTIRPDVHPVGMEPVGRYAVQFDWSDGHRTGIYSWDLLRRIAAEPAKEPS